MTNSPAPSTGRRHEWTRGDRLRIAREKMDGSPTQADFAALLGVGRNTVGRYEDDQGDKPIVLMRWSDVTGFDYEWLLNGEHRDGDPGGASITARYPTTDSHDLVNFLQAA